MLTQLPASNTHVRLPKMLKVAEDLTPKPLRSIPNQIKAKQETCSKSSSKKYDM